LSSKKLTRDLRNGHLAWFTIYANETDQHSNLLRFQRSIEAIRLLTNRRAYGKLVINPALQAD
jgi:hypothetical protein